MNVSGKKPCTKSIALGNPSDIYVEIHVLMFLRSVLQGRLIPFSSDIMVKIKPVFPFKCGRQSMNHSMI